jgi:hypothetical protein
MLRVTLHWGVTMLLLFRAIAAYTNRYFVLAKIKLSFGFPEPWWKKKGTRDVKVIYRIIVKFTEQNYFLLAAYGRHASCQRLYCW